jgi:formimidoylglutamate deiminase
MTETRETSGRILWAPSAWVQGRWASDVALAIDAQGLWGEINTGVAPAPGAEVLAGPALPGVIDAHSHAFQRAFAGLAERREHGQDDFWSWRDRMYQVALKISAEQQELIARQLFVELLRGGFTHVCEFHYLHRAEDGSEYARRADSLSMAIVRAARDTGIGLTMLPVIYERSGFQARELRADQRRFRADADWIAGERAALRQSFGQEGLAASLGKAGAAFHSLRAATPAAIEAIAQDGDAGPLHIHIAEQVREVEECVAATRLRPVQWLLAQDVLDSRWSLVHATHVSPEEIDAVGKSGAGIVVCPSTEANLGDGIFDLPRWMRSGAPLSIGTDSHVGRSVIEELRILEYSQRLGLRGRCIGARPEQGEPSTANSLLQTMLSGGAPAAGFERWGFAPGARADLLVIDAGVPGFTAVPMEQRLDALVFGGSAQGFRDVMVAGRWVCRDSVHERQAEVGRGFDQAMRRIHEAGHGARR